MIEASRSLESSQAFLARFFSQQAPNLATDTEVQLGGFRTRLHSDHFRVKRHEA